MHSNWRDCQHWEKAGLRLSTTSNEACKLYDAALTQYVGWYDDNSVGGLEGCLGKLQEADPNFVMGHVISNGLELLASGRSVTLDTELARAVKNMSTLATSAGGTDVTDREKLHVKAMNLWAEGYTAEACQVWENILILYPTDMLALKFAHDTYFYLGYQAQMRDSIARVLPHWGADMPLYGYLMGMHSFGLVETNFYGEAEKIARKGLELNRQDAWSTHSMAHVMEMTGRAAEGISFMSSTVKDWSPCGMLACHNFWHWAIYHIEKGEYEQAIGVYDSEVGVRAHQSGAMLDVVDAASLLYRLQMEGQHVGDRWSSFYDVVRPHIDDHILSFNDAHILMTCLGSKQTQTVEKMLTSLRDYVRNGKGTNHAITKEVGLALMEALVAYEDGEYNKAVDWLLPLRYKLVNIGGSNAQRDEFNLFLIHAALRSTSKDHHKLARSLLVERKTLKDNSPMTDRLIARAMALHVD